jgi:poly(ADP-ribose) glycohydrolase
MHQLCGESAGRLLLALLSAHGLQADFANEFIGGGVLGHGCVQEEIMFATCPEAMVSMALMARMETDEAIVIFGAEQFSSGSGYGGGFRFGGSFTSRLTKDPFGRIAHRVR